MLECSVPASAALDGPGIRAAVFGMATSTTGAPLCATRRLAEAGGADQVASRLDISALSAVNKTLPVLVHFRGVPIGVIGGVQIGP